MINNRYKFTVTIDVNTDVSDTVAKDMINEALAGAHGLDVVSIESNEVNRKRIRVEGPVTKLIRRCV